MSIPFPPIEGYAKYIFLNKKFKNRCDIITEKIIDLKRKQYFILNFNLLWFNFHF